MLILYVTSLHKPYTVSFFFYFLGYVTYIFEKYSDIIDSAIDDQCVNSFMRLIKKLKVTRRSISMTFEETVQIMMGKYKMSQRSYKKLRTVLKENNVLLPQYDCVRKYCREMDVGKIYNLHDDSESCYCMGYGCDIAETLQRISCDTLYEQFKFLTVHENMKLVI